MEGFGFKCKKCGKTYEAMWGDDPMNVGFGEEYLEAMRQGEYGPERQHIVLSDKSVLMDTTLRLYKCRKCGAWKVECDMGLYAPKVDNPKVVWWASYLKEQYRLIKEPFHKCDECGCEMKIDKHGFRLKCPYCGKANWGHPQIEVIDY